MKKQILVVEDEPKILEFISSYLENSGYTPLCASNGKDALQLFETHSVDLILLDLMLPDISGQSICIKLRQSSQVPIIMITAKTDDESIIAGLELGADDYITKPFSPRQLIARIKALFRRIENINNPIRRGPMQINKELYTISYDGHDLNLTSSEFSLLSILMKRPTKVFTRDELAEIMQNGLYEGYPRSIDSHIKNIRSKIADYSDFDYIRTVRGIGYQFQENESRN